MIWEEIGDMKERKMIKFNLINMQLKMNILLKMKLDRMKQMINIKIVGIKLTEIVVIRLQFKKEKRDMFAKIPNQ